MKHKAISVRQLCVLARRSMINTDKETVTDSLVASEYDTTRQQVIDAIGHESFALWVSTLKDETPTIADMKGLLQNEPFKPNRRYGVEGNYGTHICRTLAEVKAFAKSGKAGNPAKAKVFSQQGSWQRNYNV